MLVMFKLGSAPSCWGRWSPKFHCAQTTGRQTDVCLAKALTLVLSLDPLHLLQWMEAMPFMLLGGILLFLPLHLTCMVRW